MVRCPGASTAECIGPDGGTKYRIPVTEQDLGSLQCLGGVLLVASYHGVTAYRAADGRHLWTVAESRDSGLPGGHLSYLDWVLVEDTVIIPRAAGLTAHDLLTGSLRWVYTPPGGFFGMAAASDAVYVTSGRGLFALRCR